MIPDTLSSSPITTTAGASPLHYAICFDAGSSGTRVYLYQYQYISVKLTNNIMIL